MHPVKLETLLLYFLYRECLAISCQFFNHTFNRIFISDLYRI